jgi:hypothetical protein
VVRLTAAPIVPVVPEASILLTVGGALTRPWLVDGFRDDFEPESLVTAVLVFAGVLTATEGGGGNATVDGLPPVVPPPGDVGMP